MATSTYHRRPIWATAVPAVVPVAVPFALRASGGMS